MERGGMIEIHLEEEERYKDKDGKKRKDGDTFRRGGKS